VCGKSDAPGGAAGLEGPQIAALAPSRGDEEARLGIIREGDWLFFWDSTLFQDWILDWQHPNWIKKRGTGFETLSRAPGVVAFGVRFTKCTARRFVIAE
jgi:hypothetical protein